VFLNWGYGKLRMGEGVFAHVFDNRQLCLACGPVYCSPRLWYECCPLWLCKTQTLFHSGPFPALIFFFQPSSIGLVDSEDFV
jgi:hypothetical protein